MPKGYWIANNVVHDPATYEDYKKANAAPFRIKNHRDFSAIVFFD